MLKEKRIIVEDEFVTHVMEADSFNDTIKEVEAIVDLGCLHDQWMIAVNSIDMYVAINDYHRGILMESATVNTKYKTVEKKIKPVAIPLPEDSWRTMKEDPSLRDPRKLVTFLQRRQRKSFELGRKIFFSQRKNEHFEGC
jgi:hypothetical protein